MTNKKSTKRAFLMSLLSLLLCVSMFVGTTFAWFTDEVTSENNVIQSGRLDAELYYGDSADAITEDASTGAIFKYDLWEPGYTQVRYVKIVNNGNLAFKFQLNIIPNMMPVDGKVNLADVIDVYMLGVDELAGKSEAEARAYISSKTPVGTLSDLMADRDGAAYGYLLPKDGATNVNQNEDPEAPKGEISYCIALKMQETAGNEYMDLSVGEGFKVQLLATQYTWENDSFDHKYDEDAEYDGTPKANVVNTGAQWVTVADASNWNNETLDKSMYLATSFQFKPDATVEEAQASQYRYYHADYVVYADKDIEAGDISLAGFYKAFAEYLKRDVWVAMESDETITAGTEIRLVELLGVTVNYEEICQWGNDGTGFLCGINAAVDGENKAAAAGTTITVELRLYEVPDQGDCANGGGCKHPSVDCETENYITLGTYTYTVPAEIVAPSNP